jgi:hypothetical protein
MCALLVGLPDINVVGVDDRAGDPIRVHVETTVEIEGCAECGTRAWVKDRPPVVLVDLPAFGRPAVLVWRKRRWRCPDPACEVGTWTETDRWIAPARAAMTDRAGRWVTVQVGREGRTVADVARELGCDWHTVMDAVVAYGTPLIEDPARIGPVTALGLDETLFARTGRWRTQHWCTSIVDVSSPSQLLDVIPGRTAAGSTTWIERQPAAWRAGIAWGVLDLPGPYRKTFTDALGHAEQVADPFHVVKHANAKLDECRRRVQQDTLGHRGRKSTHRARSRAATPAGRSGRPGDTPPPPPAASAPPWSTRARRFRSKSARRTAPPATPPALAPHQPGRPPECGQIPDLHDHAVLGLRAHPAARTAHPIGGRLDLDHHLHRDLVHAQHPEPLEPQQRLGQPGTVAHSRGLDVLRRRHKPRRSRGPCPAQWTLSYPLLPTSTRRASKESSHRTGRTGRHGDCPARR